MPTGSFEEGSFSLQNHPSFKGRDGGGRGEGVRAGGGAPPVEGVVGREGAGGEAAGGAKEAAGGGTGGGLAVGAGTTGAIGSGVGAATAEMAPEMVGIGSGDDGVGLSSAWTVTVEPEARSGSDLVDGEAGSGVVLTGDGASAFSSFFLTSEVVASLSMDTWDFRFPVSFVPSLMTPSVLDLNLAYAIYVTRVEKKLVFGRIPKLF